MIIGFISLGFGVIKCLRIRYRGLYVSGLGSALACSSSCSESLSCSMIFGVSSMIEP